MAESLASAAMSSLDRARREPVLSEALSDLHEPLADLGRRWARSVHRPRPSAEVLQGWDGLLQAWIDSDLPLILRDTSRRGAVERHPTGRLVTYGDNSPANWAFGLALRGIVPNLAEIAERGVAETVPLSFLAKGEAAKRNLNRQGWKVCHIDPVSDRRRLRMEDSDIERLQSAFRRFLSPRNIFLIPKAIAGAGELPEVIAAIADFERGQERAPSRDRIAKDSRPTTPSTLLPRVTEL